jgi:hypothetical protein
MRAFPGSVLFLILSSPSASPPASPAPQEPLRIGVSSMITPVDTVKYYQEIIDYIGARIQRPVSPFGFHTALAQCASTFIGSSRPADLRDVSGGETLIASR